MMERAYQLCDDIRAWIDQESGQNSRSNRKLEALRVFEQEWRQVEYMIKLLEPFKEYTEAMGRTQGPTIHKAFLVYSNLFDHLEDQDNMKELDSVLKWTGELETAVENALIKMRKYYARTEGEGGLLYNIATVLNPTQKLSLYKVCFLLTFYRVFLTDFTNYHG